MDLPVATLHLHLRLVLVGEVSRIVQRMNQRDPVRAGRRV